MKPRTWFRLKRENCADTTRLSGSSAQLFLFRYDVRRSEIRPGRQPGANRLWLQEAVAPNGDESKHCHRWTEILLKKKKKTRCFSHEKTSCSGYLCKRHGTQTWLPLRRKRSHAAAALFHMLHRQQVLSSELPARPRMMKSDKNKRVSTVATLMEHPGEICKELDSADVSTEHFIEILWNLFPVCFVIILFEV